MAEIAVSMAVVAGAIGLGLAGLAASLRRPQSRQLMRQRYRNGRSAEEDSVNDSTAVERTMKVIRQQDISGCGLKMVCELAGMRREELLAEEMAILNLVGPSVNPGHDLSPGNALGEYRSARGIGEAGVQCGQAFPLCPYNSTQLIHSVLSYLP